MNLELNTINLKIIQNPAKFVRICNEDYQARLMKIADDIAQHRNERSIILLSGPSGSGKTTSAYMLEKILDERGINTHTLSLDNYFSPLTDEEKELLSEGKLDLETPGRIDSAFLSEQLACIDRCEPVSLPVYDFHESIRRESGKILHRMPGELVILEGIHSLNPDIIDFPDEKTAKIYVSVRTRIKYDNEVLHPSKIRLMRRLVRDMLFRKRTFKDTLKMFHSVEEGENKYIMPYKYRSTYDIDTFMPYEICAYKRFLAETLRDVSEEAELTDQVCRFLEASVPLNSSNITSDSLICEFIGNGQFSY